MVKKVAKKKIVKKKAVKPKTTKARTVKIKATDPKGSANKQNRYLSQPRDRRGNFKPAKAHSGELKRVDNHFKSFDLKQAFLETFQMLGGVEELANWAAYSNANQTEFYKMLAKMLPREVGLSSGDIEPNKLSGMEDKELDAIINRHLTRN